MTEINISGYRIGETVGKGKAGTVFHAVSSEDGAARALKRFDAMAIDREFLERNYRRYERTPRHPGLIDVSEFHFGQAPYFVAMEWVEASSTLDDLAGPLPEAAAWPAIYEIADSMSHLHRHGVGHGNLHPGNVFYSAESEPCVRLTDFGSGLTGRVHFIDLAESAWFAAPEQLDEPDRYGEGAMEIWDVYRFGVLAFWMITATIPRGLRYLELYQQSLAANSGRQVSCDYGELAKDLREHPGYEWPSPAESRADQLRREIIDSCLAIDPAERPKDMREVWTAFEKLEAQFDLEESQVRVCEERIRQVGKLNFTRAVAACLAIGLMAVSAALFFKLNDNRGLRAEVTELSSVVARQEGTIDDHEVRWAESLRDLKEFRSAAGSIFSQMSKSETATEESGIQREVLEQSRVYFEKTLGDLGDSPSEQFERARCLHNLAHVELQLKETDQARDRYREAADLFESIAKERADEDELIADIELQLLDCYHRLAGLVEGDPGDEVLAALERAGDLYEKNRLRRPDDRKLRIRQAVNQLELGRQLHAHRRFDDAIEVFAAAGENLAGLEEADPGEAMINDLLSRVQFRAAVSLREAGRESEAIDSHLAALETIAEGSDGTGYSREQRRRLGLSYAELGELFAGHAEGNEIKAHFNEALRLLMPLCEGGGDDPRTAILLSRSMAHIARLEREASHWTDGYKMSLAAIENLEATLENHPGHVDCQLTLSDLRVKHTETLRYNRKAALRCLDNGLTMIAAVQDQVENDETVIDPVRQGWRKRIAGIYDQYRALCESFGETEKAKMCSDRASRARALLVQSGT